MDKGAGDLSGAFPLRMTGCLSADASCCRPEAAVQEPVRWLRIDHGEGGLPDECTRPEAHPQRLVERIQAAALILHGRREHRQQPLSDDAVADLVRVLAGACLPFVNVIEVRLP